MPRKLWCRYLSLIGLVSTVIVYYTITLLPWERGHNQWLPSCLKGKSPILTENTSKITLRAKTQPPKWQPVSTKTEKVDHLDSRLLADPWFQSPYVCPKRSTSGVRVPTVQDTCLASQISEVSVKRDGGVKKIGVVTNCEKCSPGQARQMTLSNLHHCSYSCLYTENLEAADAVIFYIFKVKTEEMIPRFVRPKGQRWVMLTVEAAVRGNNTAILDSPILRGQFNWTVTYRLDSDIPRPYGQLKWRPLQRRDYDSIYRRKHVTAAWFVSNCHTQSRRRQYVMAMQKITTVHVYGLCGDRNCSGGFSKRDADNDVCFPMLSKSYFFYLAFENSLCDGYVTEKFFKIFKNVDIVPVVRGGANYKKYFPPNSFVDASDFKSAVDLARYLEALTKDKARYLAMLKVKSMYKYQGIPAWYCRLCEKLHVDSTPKWYKDARNWFVNGSCHEADDL